MPAGTAFAAGAAAQLGGTDVPVGNRPMLATDDQVAADKLLLSLLDDADIRAAQARLKADLAATPTGRSADGAARIDNAVTLWTNSLILKEIVADRVSPAIVLTAEDTPRTWLGYTVAGAGVSGDNPDHIYRITAIEGSGRYEITGRIDLQHRPAQFVLSVSHGEASTPRLRDGPKGQADPVGNQHTLLTDRDLALGRDGSFRVTIGGSANGPDHIATQPGPLSVGFRDVLSDWRQQPARIVIRRLDGETGGGPDRADLRQRVLKNLEPYVRFWANFNQVAFGGLAPNSIAPPQAREGGWGFNTGLRFQLAPDEAILVKIASAGAEYHGIQVIDPWRIGADARQHQTSLNPAQARADADGDYTFVIAPRDPGVANWLDSAGLHDGFAIIRWQNVPAGTKASELLRDFRVIKRADAISLPGVIRVTAAERRAQLAARAAGYANRTH